MTHKRTMKSNTSLQRFSVILWAQATRQLCERSSQTSCRYHILCSSRLPPPFAFIFTSPHLTSPHLTSPHLTSPHLTSPCINYLQKVIADDIYSEDNHFILEVLQNAEDNTYAPSVVPSLTLKLQKSDFTVCLLFIVAGSGINTSFSTHQTVREYY